MCPNCCSQEEMLQHLMNSYPLAIQLWEKASFHCQKKCRGPDDIINSIRLWHHHPYQSELLNYLWRLIPGLLLWTIWKERNRRIFKDQSTPLDILWHNFCLNLKQTLDLHTWTQEDYPSLAVEKAIWENWNIQLPQRMPNHRPSQSQADNKLPWSPPPQNTFKLNFDGASKGNPGTAGFGGVFRNHQGESLLLYYGNIGWDTNNSAEMEGLWQGLILSQQFGFHPLEVEGDSQILICMANQLLNGTGAHKIANSWRLEARLEAIEHWLHTNHAIIFQHVKREGNKVADLLANTGVDNEDTLLSGDLDII